MLRVRLHAEIERGFAAVRRRDRMRGRLAVIANPAPHEPGRRIKYRCVGLSDHLGALADHAPEHRVDETCIARAARIGLHQPHGKVDGGVVGDVKPLDLRGPDEERGLHARGAGGKAAFKECSAQMPQRPQPPQHRCRQGAHERAVALGQRGEIGLPRLVRQLLVERPPAVEHVFQNVSGKAPGG
jgi:hypothetical protein